METLGGYENTVGLGGNPLIANLEYTSGTRRYSTRHHVHSPLLLSVSEFAREMIETQGQTSEEVLDRDCISYLNTNTGNSISYIADNTPKTCICLLLLIIYIILTLIGYHRKCFLTNARLGPHFAYTCDHNRPKLGTTKTSVETLVSFLGIVPKQKGEVMT